MDDPKEKIRGYFAQLFRKVDLQDDTDIFATGFVNSLMAMQLVMRIAQPRLSNLARSLGT